jgi:hypothetical protein
VLIWSRGTGAGGRAEELAPVQMETALCIAAVGKGARTGRTLDFENRHRPIRLGFDDGIDQVRHLHTFGPPAHSPGGRHIRGCSRHIQLAAVPAQPWHIRAINFELIPSALPLYQAPRQINV